MSDAERTEDRWWFAFRGSELLVYVTDQGIRLPAGAAFPAPALSPQSQHQIGVLDGRPCYAVLLDADAEAPPGMAFQGLRALYGQIDPALHRLAGRAVQIVDWDRMHRYCGRCGSRTGVKPNELATECPQCGAVFFPRLSPAIIVLIRDGDRTLLARSHRFPPGRYSTIAGFVEAGESLEEAVAREVGEEVGVQVRDIRYFGSQPWPFPNSLMIGFTAEYAGGEIHLQEEEIADARWFHVDSLPDLPPAMSIARALINWFITDCGRQPSP
jgi:NAD+ diphosphatase